MNNHELGNVQFMLSIVGILKIDFFQNSSDTVWLPRSWPGISGSETESPDSWKNVPSIMLLGYPFRESFADQLRIRPVTASGTEFYFKTSQTVNAKFFPLELLLNLFKIGVLQYKVHMLQSLTISVTFDNFYIETSIHCACSWHLLSINAMFTQF